MDISHSELAESFRANLQRLEADQQARWGPGLTSILGEVESFRAKHLPQRVVA